MPSVMLATFLGLTLLLPARATAVTLHHAQLSQTTVAPGTKSAGHGKGAIKQAAVRPTRTKQNSVRVFVIKLPVLPSVTGTKSREQSPNEGPRAAGITVSPPYSLSAVPQIPVFSTPVPPTPTPQIPVPQPNDVAVPVNHTQVIQTRTNQTLINSDLMTQPMIGHTQI